LFLNLFQIGKKRYWDDCTKIEECREGGKMAPIMEHAGCHENAMCEPNDGAYKCKCKTGYRGDGINKCKGNISGLFCGLPVT
jgi:hypothetical protein